MVLQQPGATVSPRPVAAAPRATSWFAVTVFVLGSGAFFALLDPLPEGQSRPAVLLLWTIAYGIAAAALLDGLLRSRMPVLLPPALVLVVALTALSALWSEVPSLTMRRSVGLTGTVLVGFLLAQRLRPAELMDAVRRALLIVAVASLLMYAVGDARALDDVHGTLRGVVATKNSLGAFMAIGVLVSSTVAFLDRTRRRRCVLSAVPMVVALALTDSTGAAATAVLVLAGTVVAAVRPRPAGRVLLAAAAAMIVGITTIVLPQTTAERVAAAVGEDTTLTGRDAIWGESVRPLAERPVLGYGYGAFWSSSEAAKIRERLQWPVPNGHNGLLDVALDMGLLGAAAVVLLLGSLAVSGLRHARRGHLDVAALQLIVAALLVVRNIAESGLLQQNTLLTVLLAAAAAAGSSRRLADGTPASGYGGSRVAGQERKEVVISLLGTRVGPPDPPRACRGGPPASEGQPRERPFRPGDLLDVRVRPAAAHPLERADDDNRVEGGA